VSGLPVAGWILAVYVAILCIWFALSALNQIRRFSRRLARFDRFGLLPRWVFFAPDPGVDDPYLVYRTAPPGVDVGNAAELASASGVSPWLEFRHPALSGRTLWLLWRPTRRAVKAVDEMARQIVPPGAGLSGKNGVAKMSFGYILFTEMVESVTEPGSRFQWAVVRSHGFARRRRLRFEVLSDFHRHGGHAE
jgi:hypothetical protein